MRLPSCASNMQLGCFLVEVGGVLFIEPTIFLDAFGLPSMYIAIVLLCSLIFCVREMIYHIKLSSLHALGRFYMDGIKVSYNKVVELMEFVGPSYDYSSWMQIVRYKKFMCRYALMENYIQQKVSE